ncbi:MAG TPA: HAD-IC family P-type ATPase, partial [Gemmataceae bacterium]|nr:HAD-IC family P-type ATPase [Gemmataceae bacterium]
MPLLPKIKAPALKPGAAQVSPLLLECASCEAKETLDRLQTSPSGLSEEKAVERLHEHGPNLVAEEARFHRLRLLGHALINPLVILLLVLAVISILTGDVKAAVVMGIMVALGVLLRFVQEARADTAAAKLKAMINVTATVVRQEKPREIPIGQLVPGDVVLLSAGDMIPADLRLLSCKDLFINQASLTGESFPVEKFAEREDCSKKSPLELKGVCFLGTSVESGSAQGVIVATGRGSLLGTISSAIVGRQAPTSFDRGISHFTWLM